MKKNQKIAVIVMKVIGIVVTVAVLLYLAYIFLVVRMLTAAPIYKNAKDYEKCVERKYEQVNINHFPKVIPDKSKEVKLYCDTSSWDGIIMLKYKADKNYIESELKKHEYVNSDDPIGAPQKIYNMHPELVGLEDKDITYYALKTKENEYEQKSGYFPYFSGIGVSKDMDYILYYAINPD